VDPVTAGDAAGGAFTSREPLGREDQSGSRFVHREIVILLILAGVTVAAFFATRGFAASNEAIRRQDGQAWYARGQEALERGDLEAALAAFRRAATKDPNDVTYHLALAHALIAARQDDTARQLLLDLREGQPEDIASAIAFLCSERARYITGAVLTVTGGMDLFTF